MKFILGNGLVLGHAVGLEIAMLLGIAIIFGYAVVWVENTHILTPSVRFKLTP